MRYLQLTAALLPLLFIANAEAASSAGVRAYERRDYPKAIEKLAPEAERGDAEAQYYLSMSLRGQLPKPQGTYTVRPSETDPAQKVAHDWMMKAALQGHAPALTRVAEDLDEGFGTLVDYQGVLQWMEKALAAGDEGARTKLVNWYGSGHIVAPDKAKIADLRKFAALSQSSDTQARLDAFKRIADLAQQYVSTIESGGKYTDEDLANAGDPRAALRLADKASRQDTKDCVAAAKWYTRAGELGEARGFQRLAAQYYYGECAEQDFAKAREMYQRGADAADALSLYGLARITMFGHGHPVDYATAYTSLKMLEIVDAKWIANEPGPLAFTTRQLSDEQRKAADAAFAAREAELQKIVARRNTKETLRPLKSEGDASSPFSYSLSLVDRSGACAQNYLGRCSHIPFETQLEIRNGQPVTLDCKMKIATTFFPATEVKTIERRYVVRPSSTKRPVIGTIAGDVDQANSILTCESVPQPSVANGTCVIETPAGADPGKYYPKEAIKQNQEGTVVLAVTLKASGERPADVQVDKSSGFPLIDTGSLEFARATAFETNCPGERLVMPLSFKLR